MPGCISRKGAAVVARQIARAWPRCGDSNQAVPQASGSSAA